MTMVICSLLVAAVRLPAASDIASEHLVDVWTSEDGLPDSSVTAITQTPDGYLWVGTYNGLARFDGVRFVTFDPSNTPELRHARVRKLYVDPAGTLWISTYDGSLTSYRDRHFRLEWVGDGGPEAEAAAIPSEHVPPIFLLNTGGLLRRLASETEAARWEIIAPPGRDAGQLCVADAEGNIWVRTRDQKLWRFGGKDFTEVPKDELHGEVIWALNRDRDGRVWVGTDHEIAMWDNGKFRNMTPTNGEPVLDANYLFFSREDDLWVIGNGRVRRASGRKWVAECELCRGMFTGELSRLGIHEDHLGGVWLYHYGRGLFYLQPDGSAHRFGSEDQFPGRRVDAFFEDREGNIWAGVDRGGLVRLRKKQFKVIAPSEDPESRAAVTVSEDADGGIWVGTFGAGLYRLFNGRWQSYFTGGTNQHAFVFSVIPDKDGGIWASAGEEDLYVKHGDQFEQSEPPVHGVKTILPARDGTVWLGVKTGLACITNGGSRIFQPSEGVRRVMVRSLAEDAHGVIWAGAGDGTLYRVDGEDVQSFVPEDARPSQPIWSLLPDKDGVIWAGTFRGGLLRFARGKFTRIRVQDGLVDNVICQILDDRLGNLWIGSRQGIFRVAKADLNAFADGEKSQITCTAYGRYDGLPSLECSGGYQPSAWRTHDGSLLFATLKGVVEVGPQSLEPNRLPPPVVVEEVLVDGSPASPVVLEGSGPAGVQKPVRQLEIPPGRRQVEFRYTGLSLVSPDRVRFRYKLEGLDDDWVEAGTRRSAQYSFLKPRKYSFLVSACNNDGIWNPNPALLVVVVRPHLYETRWFLALVIVMGIGLVAGIVRTISVRRMRVELERVERQRAIERDRSRIAKDIHDDLGAGLTHIALLSEMARPGAPEELQSQLGQISGVARELTSNMDEIVWAVNPENDTLDGLVTYISKFAQEYLSVAGIRCRLDVPAQLPHRVLEAEVRHNLFLAVKESLHNVVQHANATEVSLRLSVQSRAFTLTIEDNGRGLAMGPALDESSRPGRVSSGHGLHNLEGRLTVGGGRCRITSEPGRGTRVEMTVKLSAGSPELASASNGKFR